MKVFLVNMDSATDRLAFMKEQLERNGVAFERVSAVVGKELSDEEVKRVASPFLQWCANGRPLNRGEIGCSLSHMVIWKKIVDMKLDCACILEDDVTVLDNIKSRLNELEHRINPIDNEVYLISAGVDAGLDGEGILPGYGSSHTCGYVVSRRAALFLYECNKPIVYPCDTWNVWCRWGLTLWKCMPRSVAHWNRKQFGSMADDYAINKVTLKSKILHKLKRCFGYPIEVVYGFIKMLRFISNY